MYTVWSLVTVRNQLPAQVVKRLNSSFSISNYQILNILRFLQSSGEKKNHWAQYLVNGDYDEHGMHGVTFGQKFLNEQGRCKLLYIPQFSHNLVGCKIWIFEFEYTN